MKAILQETLASIGTVLFTGRMRCGLLLFAALLTSPWHALLGMLGLFSARACSKILYRDNAYLQLGLPQGAGLLTGLALSAFLSMDATMFLLVPIAGILSALLVHSLYPLLGWRGLPGLALAFVLASWTLLAAAPVLGLKADLHGGMLELPGFVAQIEGLLEGSLPLVIQLFLKSFGSLLFLPTLSAGVLVLAGILLGSRITALAMLGGGILGTILLSILSGNALSSEAFGLIAFNSILTAGALSGVFLVLTRGGILYALVAVVVTLFFSTGMHGLLSAFGLPVLAAPFVLSTWLFLLPLRHGLLRSEQLNIWAPPLHLVGIAEKNLRAFEQWHRLQQNPLPVLSLPLHGVWKVTQGPNGSVTHNTDTGREAWDFMLLDLEGSAARWPGEELGDFHGFGVPVLAPAEGVITAVEGSLPDNPVHAADTEQPWGNWVMISHDNGTVSLLAHLRAGSIRMLPGQRVTRGQEIAQVGNSGRSPEPHLHLQLNDSPWLAGQSLPALFGSWVELRADAPVFHPLGRPEEGMSVSGLMVMDWEDWSLFFPYSVPGRSWQVRCRKGRKEEQLKLHLYAGIDGRLLLDDGITIAQVLWWPGWIRLLPLHDSDPAKRPDLGRKSANAGLVDWLLCLSPAIPARGVSGLLMEDSSFSPLLTQIPRRLFGLESRQELRAEFCLDDAGLALEAKIRSLSESGEDLHMEWLAEQRRGLRAMRVTRGNHELFSAEWLDEGTEDS